MAQTLEISSETGALEVYYTAGVQPGEKGAVMCRLGPTPDGRVGLEIFNPAGQVVVRADNNGDLMVTGQLQTELNDVGITFYTYGNQAWSRWSINDSSGNQLDHMAEQVAWDQGAPFGQTLQTMITRRADLAQDGGKQMLTQNAAILSHQPASGVESYLALGGYPFSVPGGIYLQGKFHRASLDGPNGAIWAHQSLTGAGFSGASYVYGYTMPDYMCPVITMTGTIGETYLVTAISSTGFTFSWSGTGSHRQFMWVPRVNAA